MNLTGQLQKISTPIDHPDDLDPLIDRIADSQIVMLGEASHGTSEYYMWRAAITKRLVAEHGFSFIAVEGDWPACYEINRYIKHYRGMESKAVSVLKAFTRWPTWMWANFEIVELMDWLRAYNAEQADSKRVGFYGLDVYSLWESMDAVIQYLERVDPDAVVTAKQAYTCFEPYGRDEQEYARATMLVPTSCEREVIDMLVELRRNAETYEKDGRDTYFNAEQNALITKNAEQYYRTMVYGGSASWNVRDHHMTETLDRLLRFHGKSAKAIVWAHNTHIGDARFTDMATHGMVNIGELAREKYGTTNVFLVGFGSYEGTVIAGREWGEPMETMKVPKAEYDSFEAIMHRLDASNRLLIFPDEVKSDALLYPIPQRAIGVVYDPTLEWGNYVPTIIPKRYDAFLYFDTTRALHPITIRPDAYETPETYPSAL